MPFETGPSQGICKRGWLFKWPRWLVCLLVLCAWAGHSRAAETGPLPAGASSNATPATSGLISGQFESRGLVRSRMRVEYRSELVAPVLETPFLAGEACSAGDVLLAIDCSRQRAEMAAAAAGERAAGIESQTKARLHKHGAAGKDEVALAGAVHAKANAELEAHKVRLAGCEVVAPYAGRVVELNVHPLELPPVDRPLIVFLDTGQPEVEMVVPSKWMVWLKQGASLAFTVDETGQTHRASLTRIGAEVDAVSQTIRVIARFPVAPDRLLPGMSGTARFAGES